MSPSTDMRENREFASEIKFLVRPALAAQIRDWARARLAPDPHAQCETGDAYPITSLYFDTARFDVFHRRGSFGRGKCRIRRYGASEVVFLERKLKTRGLLAKRRSLVTLDELERLAEAEVQRGWAGCWFHRRLLARSLKPVCQISYRRTARVAMTRRGPIRLTLDDDLRAVRVGGVRFGAQEGARLSEDRIILELKFRHEMPALFKYLVEEFALEAQPFSKYRLAAIKLGLARETATGFPERNLADTAEAISGSCSSRREEAPVRGQKSEASQSLLTSAATAMKEVLPYA
ncbi:MAG: polyphosphate polymerase domain-containing protein [Verrucomicrobia bacterium]|nr:polyphosphate polymerase domain-containing protein [Verrucomicrobiota bacterium]